MRPRHPVPPDPPCHHRATAPRPGHDPSIARSRLFPHDLTRDAAFASRRWSCPGPARQNVRSGDTTAIQNGGAGRARLVTERDSLLDHIRGRGAIPRRERLAQARENRIGYARTTTLGENQWPRPVPGWIQPATDSLTQTHLSTSGFGPRQLQVRGGGHVGAATCPHVRGAWIATLAVIAGPPLETGEG